MTLLLPVSYFPPVSYCAKAMLTDRILLEMYETYPKQTIRNHCEIYGPNGRLKLTVPVIRVNGNHTATKDVKIDNSGSWQRIHIKALETAYNKSPYFIYYFDEFRPCFQRKYSFLCDLNLEIIHLILKILKSKTIISLTDQFEKDIGGNNLFEGKKPNFPPEIFPSYTQVFEYRSGFLPDLSFLDLIFNTGPESWAYLQNVREKMDCHFH